MDTYGDAGGYGDAAELYGGGGGGIPTFDVTVGALRSGTF